MGFLLKAIQDGCSDDLKDVDFEALESSAIEAAGLARGEGVDKENVEGEEEDKGAEDNN